MTKGAPKLEVAGLDAFYGPAQVLFGVDLSVREGEVAALIGRNGAGKSTTLRAIIGLASARSEVLRFDGADISALPTQTIVRRGLGYVPEDRRIFTELTVEENLAVGRRPARPGTPQWTPERLFDLFPNLADMRGRLGGAMSGGEQQMLTIARTLMGNPSMILLDEPSEGLAPKIVDDMAAAIAAMRREGISILLSEQNRRFARMIADRAHLLERGRIIFSGSFEALERRDEPGAMP
ncbi:ABC transporter ATP-binding protein [Aurantimonas sp. VKM B-3413]|uniref:ABC transporter ATP-binding protein n=1 Tax=Aurantimonas sp. VKM B-3413 TaxID=2779401 RepID=UPI001E52C243|nr:ABC transporter ATP-binding protein [Aurantimonas sp. VKM B-3413]MCB8838681.1 ABC transporter ATP-binding protein [Aurantimonas sp. VKM B-3413]